MSDTADKHRASMSKCKTVDEWARKHLRGEPSQKFKDAFAEVHGEAPKPRRRRRTKAEMEADGE